MAGDAVLTAERHENGGRMTNRPAAFIVNAEAGTVRTRGAEAVKAVIEAALPQWPAGSDVKLLKGADIEGAIGAIIASKRYGAVIIGGGDGTVSSTAGQLAGTGLALGIMPLGTMNLLARAVGIDLNLEKAIDQLRTAEEKSIDVGRANGRVFLHHVAFGVQPRMVKIREKLGYSSRYTKMLGSVRAFLSVMFDAKTLRLGLSIDRDGRRILKTPALIVSNNVYEDSMWLKPANLDDGLLGIYALRTMPLIEYLKLAFDLLRGQWRRNLNVDEWQGKSVTIERFHKYRKPSTHLTATADGELVLLSLPVDITIDPKALTVLIPVAAAEQPGTSFTS